MKYIIIAISSLFSIHLAQAACFNCTHNNISLNYNQSSANVNDNVPCFADNNENLCNWNNVLCIIPVIKLAAPYHSGNAVIDVNGTLSLMGNAIPNIPFYIYNNGTLNTTHNAPSISDNTTILVTIATTPFYPNASITTPPSPFTNPVPCYLLNI